MVGVQQQRDEVPTKTSDQRIIGFNVPLAPTQGSARTRPLAWAPRTCTLTACRQSARRPQRVYPGTRSWMRKAEGVRMQSESEVSDVDVEVVVVRMTDKRNILTPGAGGTIVFHQSVLMHLVKKETKTFAITTMDQPSVGEAPATLLNVTSVAPCDDGSNLMHVECLASARVRLKHVEDDDSAAQKHFTMGRVCALFDDVATEHEQRATLADAEWQTWLAHLETARLARRLGQDGSPRLVEDEQKVRIFAPKHYDRALSADEWAVTPEVTRYTWCRRVESFSFAVLRCLKPSDDDLWRAMCVQNTLDRLLIVADCIQREQARIYAQLSLKDALG